MAFMESVDRPNNNKNNNNKMSSDMRSVPDPKIMHMIRQLGDISALPDNHGVGFVVGLMYSLSG